MSNGTAPDPPFVPVPPLEGIPEDTLGVPTITTVFEAGSIQLAEYLADHQPGTIYVGPDGIIWVVVQQEKYTNIPPDQDTMEGEVRVKLTLARRLPTTP